MKKSDIKVDRTYQGRRHPLTGNSPRRSVVSIGDPSGIYRPNQTDRDVVTYDVVAGPRPWGQVRNTCTRKAFARWAVREVKHG